MDLEEFLTEWHNDSPTVLVHTSGSTGKPKPMHVEKRRMEASARTTCEFLGLHEGDTALLCMSLDYIAGKMMVVRALTCGLRLIVQEPSGKPELPSFGEGLGIDLCAMVPLQVWNLLHDAEGRERLKQIRHLIIGGGAIDEALERELQDFPNAVWSTYGMTETLSHIALRRLNGPSRSNYYTPLPGVTLYPPSFGEGQWVGSFRILGRKDNVICSGGIKIQIEEAERLLRPHLSIPYLITRARDEKLGEIVVLLVEAPLSFPEEEKFARLCRQVLPKYWVPRRIIAVPHIPLTETVDADVTNSAKQGEVNGFSLVLLVVMHQLQQFGVIVAGEVKLPIMFTDELDGLTHAVSGEAGLDNTEIKLNDDTPGYGVSVQYGVSLHGKRLKGMAGSMSKVQGFANTFLCRVGQYDALFDGNTLLNGSSKLYAIHSPLKIHQFRPCLFIGNESVLQHLGKTGQQVLFVHGTKEDSVENDR